MHPCVLPLMAAGCGLEHGDLLSSGIKLPVLHFDLVLQPAVGTDCKL
jgi:hypothetical protein